MPTIYGEDHQFIVVKKNGDKLLEGTLIDKKLENELRIFQKGVLASRILYKDGKREGPYTIFNPKTGLLMKIGVFHKDKKEGEIKIFDDKGSIIGKDFYENDVLQQKVNFYPTGEVLKEQIYQNGKEVTSKTFYKSGNLIEEKYSNDKGELVKMGRYMDDGTTIETFTTKLVR